MKRETLEKAKETLIDNIIKKIEKGEIKLEYYAIINNAIYDFIAADDKKIQLERDAKLKEDMAKYFLTDRR